MNTTQLNRNYVNFKVHRDDRAVVTVLLDAPGRSFNVLDQSLLTELQDLVSLLQDDPNAKLVVFRSGKRSGFLAGADLQQISQLHTEDEIQGALQIGQRLFDSIAALPIPSLAVIHGACLGGGLEMAMACRFRFAKDDPQTKLGLPETQLGLLPGWGGTQRLPALVDLQIALAMLLEGKRLSAQKAERCGIVDRVAPEASFDEELARFVGQILQSSAGGLTESLSNLRGAGKSWYRKVTRSYLGRSIVFHFARRQIRSQAKFYPALEAALHAAEEGLRRGIVAGLKTEREEFSKLIHTQTHRNLLRIALHRDRARKTETWVSGEHEPLAIHTVGVIGAGIMGAEIAAAFASAGMKVVLIDQTEQLVASGLKRLEDLLMRAADKGVMSVSDAQAHRARVCASTDWNTLREADLVIEAVVERMDVKHDVFRRLDCLLAPHALIVSNTSALSISSMAQVTERAAQVGGLHFFNPVHKMPLVEVVRGAATNATTVATLVRVVRQLGKVPLVTGEGPGFVVNRILFPYFDEAIRLATEGVPVELIDREAKRFGMPMGPLELLDTVGIDVAASVAKTLLSTSEEASPAGDLLGRMNDEKRLGKKSGHGFYAYKNGHKGNAIPLRQVIVNRHLGTQRIALGAESFSEIQLRLAFAMVNEAAKVLQESIVSESWMVDLAMVLGTGFAPFRGGPLRMAETWGVDATVNQMHEFARKFGARFQPTDLARLADRIETPNSYASVR
jgi:3-hydroxyacyl-CoA dehydrogenase / enoyl-CoA hydratase / 3-hydroxybutyryl-CoA epimerase